MKRAAAAPGSVKPYEALLIGAGMSSMYPLYRLRDLGRSVCVCESGEGMGSTWYGNRYPGARCDAARYSYG